MAQWPNVIDCYGGDLRPAVPDFAELGLHGIFGVMHMCTRGNAFVDPRYKVRRDANANNLLWGSYHFLTASPVDEQAQNFLTNCGDLANVCVAVAFEDNGAASTGQLMEYMAAIDAALPIGGQTVLFGGNRVRQQIKPAMGGHVSTAMQDMGSFFAGHRLWLDEIGPHDNVPWPWNDKAMSPLAGNVFLWAYRQIGPVDPVIGKTDLHWSAAPDKQTLSQHWGIP
jgi:hypothetical protein